jgi:hypothetical protein
MINERYCRDYPCLYPANSGIYFERNDSLLIGGIEMKKYSHITNEMFDNKLAEIMDDEFKYPSQLLSIPGIYEIVSEYFNNDVLDELTDYND